MLELENAIDLGVSCGGCRALEALIAKRGSAGDAVACNEIGETLGVPCYAGCVERAAEAIVSRALRHAGGYAALCNVHVLMTAKRQPELSSALDDAWAVFPDGAPVAWQLRHSGWPIAQRVAGPDLMPAVLEQGLAYRLRHYLLGSTPEVLAALVPRLQRRFPRIQIVGQLAPFGDETALDAVVPQVRETRPQVVWCALGAPKQELWMCRNATRLAPAVLVGVGAAFDFHSEMKARAPRWMQQAGLEWLHRFLFEPRRLLVRYLTTNTEFLARATLDLARRGR